MIAADPRTSGSGTRFQRTAQDLYIGATKTVWRDCGTSKRVKRSVFMNSIIYLVGLVVVILAVLSFFGLR
jgi:hypothetical protein